MMDNLENMDQLFREGLHDFAPVPPANGWQRLQGELDRSKKVPLIPYWVRIAASIILVAGAALLGWRYFTQSDAVQEEVLASEQIPVENNDPSVAAPSDAMNEKPDVIRTPERAEPYASVADATATEQPGISENNELLAVADETDLKDEEPVLEMYTAESAREEIALTKQNSLLGTPENSEAEKEIQPVFRNKRSTDKNDLIIQNNLLAMNEGESTKRKASWSVGGHAGPQYTYRDVTVNAMPYNIDDYDKYESGVTTYAGGLQVEVEPARRFSIQSGLYYSKIGQVKTSLQIDNQYAASIANTWGSPNVYVEPPRGSQAVPADVVNSTGNITFDKNYPPPIEASGDNTEWVAGTYTAEQYFEFVEVPLILSYKLIDKKLDLNISSGIWANFLVGNKAIATDNESFTTRGKTTDINTINYCGSLSLGLDYPLSKRLALSIEPFFKYYLSPINTNPQTEVYPYSMGVMSGVKYSF